ncbi:exodeoxyribonuclease V subunit alpha [Pseudomonas sp. 5P_3.1_Bac2]|uniref:exodeoxyribonuclease V subunit alpha n=1 Tax=Pseudomonas sp. 5P_3.1_Bac2 TaxID=2971617 RepID=UPI0021C97569|nr:exodeoxyribonuclease V subunit alpha [Pseudomonas sp. 5P_3.1_Bac2]MCU1719468.1 exodeoxyribonuclease V subunit alpha [Pseudomonas sp. 5P_3.1_Bac2]
MSPYLEQRGALFELLAIWSERGWLREVDRALGQLLAELDPAASPLLLLAAALASHQLGKGHVCLDLASTLADPDFALSLPPEGEEAALLALLPSQVLAGVSLDSWLAACAGSGLLSAEAGPVAPLVLADSCLYLRRYWDYERQVAGHIAARLQQASDAPAQLAQRLQQLFPEPLVLDGERLTDWQKLACALASRSRFTLITGGPGTGKTTTVVRLLALLQEAAMNTGAPLRLSLAAPTGKAAARLTESIGAQVASLPVSDAVRGQIPSQVTTLHRLLGSRPDSRHFRHHHGNLLPLDVLVVDEASMIDLEMMANLLDALPAHARLILLGDKDQLASVEAGAVLGDLCRDAESGGYSAATCAWLTEQTGEAISAPQLQSSNQALAQHIVMLRHSRRFAGGSGIGRLARAVNERNSSGARAILAAGSADLHDLRLSGEQDRSFERLVLDGLAAKANGQGQAPVGYRHYLQVLSSQRPAPEAPASEWDGWAKQVLSAFDQFQLLCAVRKGPWGVEALNERISQALQRQGLLSQDQGWYEGRPVLVTRNDYSLGLMNGDIGIALRLPEPASQPGSEPRQVLRVVFPRNDGSGELSHILPSRLSAVETVFAMTVHKSQGSEFAHCALILPDSLNPVLTKELVYTGITRARSWFSLIESRAGVFEQAVARQVERRSGLRAALLTQTL